MKKLITTLSILLIATASYAQTYTVERVIDGDPQELSQKEFIHEFYEHCDKYFQRLDKLNSGVKELWNDLEKIRKNYSHESSEEGKLKYKEIDDEFQAISWVLVKSGYFYKEIDAFLKYFEDENTINSDETDSYFANIAMKYMKMKIIYEESRDSILHSVGSLSPYKAGKYMKDLLDVLDSFFRSEVGEMMEKIFYTQTYTVERVIDGDIIVVGKSEQVRLIGIDAPESNIYMQRAISNETGQDLQTLIKMGQEATEFVKGFLKEGQEVFLEFDVEKRDKYGRVLAYVHIPTQEKKGEGYELVLDDQWTDYIYIDNLIYIFVNSNIVKAGYATPMTIPPNVKYADLFKELYDEAREQKRGLWKDSLTISAEGESCLNKLDCSKIDCTKYDNEIKNGYRPDCVNNTCKCMCYGCK